MAKKPNRKKTPGADRQRSRKVTGKAPPSPEPIVQTPSPYTWKYYLLPLIAAAILTLACYLLALLVPLPAP